MKFRRRIKVFPGVRLNISGSGISTTIGVPGLSVNLGSKGTYLNTGFPGTGLYDRQRLGGPNASGSGVQSPNAGAGAANTGIGDMPANSASPFTFDHREIQSIQAELTTTPGLQSLKQTLTECKNERAELASAISSARGSLLLATIMVVASYILIFGFFVKGLRAARQERASELADLETQLEHCVVSVDLDLTPSQQSAYQTLQAAYGELSRCAAIWDITSIGRINRVAARSIASESISRSPVRFGGRTLEIARTNHPVLHFSNSNGGDLHIHPGFLAIIDGAQKFGLVGLGELRVTLHEQQFNERGAVPRDARVIGYTWHKANKNGSPDRRFKENYQIPICQYGEVLLSSDTGLRESYSFSNFQAASRFVSALRAFQLEMLK